MTRTVKFFNSVFVLAVVAFIFAPVASLIIYSFNASWVPTFPISKYSFRWYVAAWKSEHIREGLWNSIIVALVTGSTSCILAFVTVYGRSKRQWIADNWFVALVSLPAFVPTLFGGIALGSYYRIIGLQGGLAAVAAAHICISSPFAVGILRHSYEQLNPDLELAALNLGASHLYTMWKVLLPQLRAALTAASLLSFVISWDEFALAWFVSGFHPTLPVVIFESMASSLNPSLNAVGGCAVLVSLSILVFVAFLVRFGERRRDAR